MRVPQETRKPRDTGASRQAELPRAAGGGETPPKWRAERFFERLGRLPRGLGRALDFLARVPVLGWGIAFFSSIWLGLLWLALIGVYIAIGSGYTPLRAYFELTDLDYFDAWPMQVLLVLLCTTLTVVTLRRIPLTLFKAGVWTVHIGILVLVAGCVTYFSQKVEGLTRIYLGKTADAFYDATERAIYVYRMGDDGTLGNEMMTPLPRLPIYHEHLAQTGNPLNLPLDAASLSLVRPGLERVPIRLVGYYPDAVLREDLWGPGPKTEQAKVRGIALNAGRGTMNLASATWLANTPAGRIFENEGAGFAAEYLYQPSALRMKDLSTAFEGSAYAVTVRVPKLGVEKTIPLRDATPIAIEGTPYTIKALEPAPPMTMASAGYEGARSGGFRIEVTRKDPDGKTFVFTRFALFRFPELSPDFVVENGKPKRVQARVDHDIDIVFHDATLDQFWLLQNAPLADEWVLIHRARGGKVTSEPIAVGKSVETTVAGKVPLTIELADASNNVVPRAEPLIVPERQRMRASNVQELIQRGTVAVEVGSGETAQTAYVPFVSFAQTSGDRGRKPTEVDVPGVGRIGLVLSSTRRPLPATLTLIDFKLKFLPGSTQFPVDYTSTFSATEETRSAFSIEKRHIRLVAHLNNPAEYQGLSFFQAQWDGDPDAPAEKRFTVLGVGNRPGIHTMLTGCLLMLTGVLYAFYLKPILQNRKKQQLAAWSQAR